MNTSAYIDSGILEEYVLGVVSPQEKREVECLSHIYPEVMEEIIRLEKALEHYTLQHEVPVPGSVKEKVFSQMTFGRPAAVASEPDEIEERETTVRPLWGRLAVAASILLALFGAWALFELNARGNRNEALRAEANELKERTNLLQQKAEYNETLAAFYRNPDIRPIRMPGLDKAPGSAVVALWNQKTNEVVLDVQNLPVAPTGKQYQLWSIVDGKPVSLGMLDPAFLDRVLQMEATQPNPAAFAITLEKTGGSPAPTMEEMYVMGQV